MEDKHSSLTDMKNSRITQLLEDVRLASEDNFEVMIAARNLILQLVTDATEEIKYGGILFFNPKPFCGVFAYASHVTVEFSHGANLPDEAKILQGNGKLRRHIKLTQVNDIDRLKVAQYVKSAATAG